MLIRSVLTAFAFFVHMGALAQKGAQLLDISDFKPKTRLGAVVGAIPGDGKEAADQPRYGIREDLAETGSNIRRNLVTGSLPFDKRYDELTPGQQALFRSQYVQLGPRDEPPFPATGLATVYKAISVAQGALQVQGKLSMFVAISSTGEPISVSVYESPDPRITRAVASILMLEKYKPALCDGTPCQMGFPVRLGLELR
jgi:hypothetical protein